MDIRDSLSSMLDQTVKEEWHRIQEIRLRVNQAVNYRFLDGNEHFGLVVDRERLLKTVHMLMENSLYACEEELRQGYFTAEGGCRVGVCGKMSMEGGQIRALSAIGSICIRVPRQIKGCADGLLGNADGNLLILSPPGLGKTTLLRDLIRVISNSGKNVGVCDERREIAACREGIPTMDLGDRTDVMDGCPKALAIPMLIRACAPDVIAVDEIGSLEDTRALRDAARCGVRLLATSHAASIADAKNRINIGEMIAEGVFDQAVVLSDYPGKISEIRKLKDGVEA